MPKNFLTIAAIASFAFVFLGQGKAHAGFLVEQGDAWHSVGDDVGSGATAPDADDGLQRETPALPRFLSQFLKLDASQFGRIGCSAPGGMSSSSGDTAGSAGSVFVITSFDRVLGVQSSMWLRFEGSPRLPPPLTTMILQPPRA